MTTRLILSLKTKEAYWRLELLPKLFEIEVLCSTRLETKNHSVFIFSCTLTCAFRFFKLREFIPNADEPISIWHICSSNGNARISIWQKLLLNIWYCQRNIPLWEIFIKKLSLLSSKTFSSTEFKIIISGVHISQDFALKIAKLQN